MITAIAAKAALGTAWGFLKRIPWQAWAGLGLVVLVLWLRSHWIGVGEARVQAQFDAYKAEMVKKTEAARVAAKRAESAQAGAIATAIDKFREGQKNAKQTGASVTAGLNDGSVKLREHWQGCPKHLPTAAAGSERSDEGARLRAASAGRVVATGADADAQVTALQAIIRSAPHCFKVE